jgi:hypothetical protein
MEFSTNNPAIHAREYALFFEAMKPDEVSRKPCQIAWNELDWNYLFEAGIKHQLSPLLYFYLKKQELLHHVPETFRDMLKNVYYASLERGIRQQEEYLELARTLSTAGVPHKPLKGIAWIPEIYNNNPALRPMTDIDIIVPENHKIEAREVLLERGYALHKPNTHHDHHDMMVRNWMIVDIHTKPFIDILGTLFPEFKRYASLDEIDALSNRPLAAVHYWINRNRPAIKLCDYMRLKTGDHPNFFKGLKTLLNKTDRIIDFAEQNNTWILFCNMTGYKKFWGVFFLKTLLTGSFKNPINTGRLFKELVLWQLKR